MDNREKMRAGLLYDASGDTELCQERERAKNLCLQFNNLPYGAKGERRKILEELLGHAGTNCDIIGPFMCDYGYNIEVGDNFFANNNFTVLDGAKVTIGNNVCIAPNVGIYTAGHPLNARERARGLEYAYPVSIGDDVWIGAGVSVLPGVCIGARSVIGAGSVVTKDIPEDVLAFGNPCRIVRKIDEAG